MAVVDKIPFNLQHDYSLVQDSQRILQSINNEESFWKFLFSFECVSFGGISKIGERLCVEYMFHGSNHINYFGIAVDDDFKYDESTLVENGIFKLLTKEFIEMIHKQYDSVSTREEKS